MKQYAFDKIKKRSQIIDFSKQNYLLNKNIQYMAY